MITISSKSAYYFCLSIHKELNRKIKFFGESHALDYINEWRINNFLQCRSMINDKRYMIKFLANINCKDYYILNKLNNNKTE